LFGRKDLAGYIEKGYVTDTIPESTSITLDYYIADAAIARAAGVLGKHSDEKVLAARSKRYSTVFNNKTHFFQAKEPSGEFKQSEKIGTESGFTEATAWQYRFFLPHDVEGLEKLYEGKLCESIKSMMEFKAEDFSGDFWGNALSSQGLKYFSKDFGLYTHGNQPVHHVLWVAKKAGCNELADKYLRKVMEMLYTPGGWAGDEDNGEMAAWYVLSALGLYSLEGAKDELVLGSPAVKHALVKLPKGRSLTIATENQAKDHVYVQSVRWTPQTGATQTISGNVIKFTEIMQGGTLSFVMAPHPKSQTV